MLLSDDPVVLEELSVVVVLDEDVGDQGCGDDGWLGAPHIIRPRTSATISPMIRPITRSSAAIVDGESPPGRPFVVELDWFT